MARTDFNNHKKWSSGKKRIVIFSIMLVLSVVITCVLLKYLVPVAQSITNEMETTELVAVVSIIVTVLIAMYKLGGIILAQTCNIKKSISLSVECVDRHAIISCTISNKDTRRIIPANIYLIIEEGIAPQNDGEMVRFPFMLNHANGQCDCILAKHCKQGVFKAVPPNVIDEEFVGCYRKVVRLDHLCAESKHYIDPGEEFSEDVIFQLKQGVYRVIAIWTSVKDDCICTLKEFVVPPCQVLNTQTNSLVDSNNTTSTTG